MTEQEASTVGEPPPPYMVFLLVFVFFLTGLLGFLVCYMLKKRGYRCRTGEPEDDCEDKLGTDNDDDGSGDENQDTVEQILKCIIENEANMEAFKEMLVTQNVCEHHDPRLLRKESLGGIPPHHHTVHSGGERNTCHLCMQGRAKKARRRSRMARGKAKPGEQTVLSVGRFRVIHMDKKNSLQGSTNLPIPGSGDQSENTEPLDSEDTPKKGQPGYNLRNMFKDAPEAINGMVPKRKKSVTLLGFRRVSDPMVTKGSLGEVDDANPEQRHASLDRLGAGAIPPIDTETAKESPNTGGPYGKLEVEHDQIAKASLNSAHADNGSQKAGSPGSKLQLDVQILKTRSDSLQAEKGSPKAGSPGSKFVVEDVRFLQASPGSLRADKGSPKAGSPDSKFVVEDIQILKTSSESLKVDKGSPKAGSPSSKFVVEDVRFLQVSPGSLRADKGSPKAGSRDSKFVVEDVQMLKTSSESLQAGSSKVESPDSKLDLEDVRVTKASPGSDLAGKGSPMERSPDSKLEVQNVRIIKASPDSAREFAVVRMKEVKEVVTETTALADEGKDDMVEMEDIRDCRVSREEDGLSLEEKRRSGHSRVSREEDGLSLGEKRRSGHSQHKW